MQNKIPMTKFEPPQSHSEPALDVSWEKDVGTIFDDEFKVRLQELEN